MAIHYKPFRFIRKAYLQAESFRKALQSLKKQRRREREFY